MCGITAISRVVGRSSINDPRQFMRLAALAIEPRGKDATGFGWSRPGGEVMYWKTPQRAQDATALAPLDRDFHVAIGHTRWKTQGDPKDNRNNHPVVDDGIVLVHNGTVDNDWELYDWFGKDYTPKADVDSQVIATMLANKDVFHAKQTTDLLEVLEGTAALAWIEVADPDTLHLARVRERPLTIGWTRLGDMVMSSTPETLHNLSVWSNIRLRNIWEVPEGRYITVTEGEIVSVEEFTPLEPKPKTYTSTYGYTGYSSYSGAGVVSKYTPKQDTLLSHDKPGTNVVPFDRDRETRMIQDELDAWWDAQEADAEQERFARLEREADAAGDGRWVDDEGLTWVPIFDGDEVVDWVILDEYGYFIGLAAADGIAETADSMATSK